MAFIGNTNTTQAFTPAIDYFSGNGSTTAFTLSRPVASVAQVQVTIDNVAQNPSSAYTVSANTITFTSAPLSGTNNIYVYYTSPITDVIAPGQGTVTATSFVSSTGTGAGVFQTSPTITTPVISSLSSASATALTLQSAGTTAVTIDTSQNVGIGTTSPSTKLSVVQNQNGASQVSISNNTGGASSQALFSATDGTNYGQFGMWGSGVSASGAQQPSSAFVYGSGGISYFTGGVHRWYYNTNTEAMRIDSSGNVGIGTTSPSQLLDVNGTAIATNIVLRSDDSDVTWSASGSRPLIRGNKTNNTLAFYTSSAERMRIDSSGNLLMGTTSQIGSGKLCIAVNLNVLNPLALQNTVTQGSGQSFMYMMNSAGNKAGSIDHTGTTTVAYTTSSDYRMKENIAPMTGALTTVLQLKPCTYTWKEDGKAGQGFIAHELQAVVPDCVSGEKDAVDAKGNPKYQGIDTSFLVATLTAAIQELKAINDTQAETINALTARIEALENR
jgi:hypothetical protein